MGIAPFDLVVSNLYPFAETVRSGAAPDEVIEQIDIGGPSMVRAAAKNHASVAVIVNPGEYDAALAAIAAGGFTLAERQALAVEAFRHTATYDIHVASWMGTVISADDEGTGFPGWVGMSAKRRSALRYGENPHQAAALYVDEASEGGIANAEQLHGKEMSYNNYVDADAAWRAAHDHDGITVAVVKHANPCGIAVGADVAEAHAKAHACDPVSAYGGVIATNREVTAAAARQIAEIFTEVVAAPSYEAEALAILTAKKNLRLLVVQGGRGPGEFRPISGGLLMQRADRIDAPGDVPATWTLAAGPAVSSETLDDLEFAWRAVRSTKSNAILLAKGGASVGIGMGQVNRVDSCRLAVARAGAERASGSVGASDAYFPFADGFQVLADAGVIAVVEPGGSIRDAEVIAAAEAAGVSLYLTGTRHFFH
jgi:phosphoribosylaminoimidazolecarboxamide formyltransferase/IMP cyclohydrolase